MAHKQVALCSPAAMAAEPSRAVFIDTSLGTHLLMRLSRDDTVSHFRRKIEEEHALNFSDSGEIVVHALKVRRRGVLYRLSDSLLVQEAFNIANNNWFLHVDASTVEKKRDDQMHIENISPDNPLPCLVASMADKSVVPSDHSLKHVQNTSLEEASQPNQTLKNKRKPEQMVEKSCLPEMEVETSKEASSVDSERVEIGVVGDNNLGTTTSVSNARENKRRKKLKDKVANEILPSGLPPHTTSALGEGKDGVSEPKPREQESSAVLSKLDQHVVVPEDNSSLIVKEPEKVQRPIEVHIYKDTGCQVETEVQTSHINVSPDLAVQSEAIGSIDSQKKKKRKKKKDPVLSSQVNKQGTQANVSIEPLQDIGVESDLPPTNKNEEPRMNTCSTVSPEEDRGVIGTEVTDNQKTADNVAEVGNGKEESVEKNRKMERKSSAKVGKSSTKKFPNVQAKVGKSSAKKNKLVVSTQENKEGRRTNFSNKSHPDSGVQTGGEQSNRPPKNTNEVPRINPDSTVSADKDKGISGTEATNNQNTTDNGAEVGNKEEETVQKKRKTKQNSFAKVGKSSPIVEKSSTKKLPNAQAEVGDAQKIEFATVSNSYTKKQKTTVGKTATSDKLRSGIISNSAISAAKVSSKDDGATKHSLEPKKKLATMSGSIFMDASEGSSEDDGTDSSCSSTGEPSDYSSDYSDGASKAKATEIGSQTPTVSKSVDGKFIAKPRSGKDFLDTVLRGSSRFKKAITTVHQSQLGEESQPVDAVPDSEPV